MLVFRDGGCEDWVGGWTGRAAARTRCGAAVRGIKSKCTALAGRFLGSRVDLVSC